MAKSFEKELVLPKGAVELTRKECESIRGGCEIPFEETFVSPFEKDTYEEANKVLEKIRSSHSEDGGWKEIEGYVEPLSNGKFRAIRRHTHTK